ncbi:MAG TPA: hypothetical protein VN841_23455 [Bryobacteraceae bacterium]|nr:hypothetical protein [Bryobacteraceae bacterium]
MAKEITREQAERKKAQAVAFLERIGEPDRAEEFEDMDVEEYAEHKGVRLANPRTFKRRNTMPKSTGPSKTELEGRIDSAIDLLDDAYAPETTREDLAEAVGKALDILKGEDEDESDDDEDNDED